MNQSRRLPFRVSVATSEAEIREAVGHRAKAYEESHPTLAAALKVPEWQDVPAPGRQILVARSNVDGSICGSLRTHLSVHEPLPLQGCVELPASLGPGPFIEITRLAVTAGLICRMSLFKAVVLYARLFSASYCVVAARPRVSVIHESVGFKDVFSDGRTIPLNYAGGAEHRILWIPMETEALSQRCMEVKRSLHSFIFEQNHQSDIDLSNAIVDSDSERSIGAFGENRIVRA